MRAYIHTYMRECIHVQERRAGVRNAGHPRPTPGSCGRRVLTPLGCRRWCVFVCACMYVCVCALPPPGRSVGVETIGGRCVELDAEEISHVSRAVAVVLSATRSSVSVEDELPARLYLPFYLGSRFTHKILIASRVRDHVRPPLESRGGRSPSLSFPFCPSLWVLIEKSRVRLLDIDEEIVRSVGFCNGTFRSTSWAVYARRRCRANNTTRLPAHRNAGYCNGRRY